MGNKRSAAFTAFFLPQIGTGDLGISIVGQQPSPNPPLGDEFEPGPMKMIRFEASLRRWGLGKQDLEHAPRHATDALIVAHPDAG